jgi:hypothetical protein
MVMGVPAADELAEPDALGEVPLELLLLLLLLALLHAARPPAATTARAPSAIAFVGNQGIPGLMPSLRVQLSVFVGISGI